MQLTSVLNPWGIQKITLHSSGATTSIRVCTEQENHQDDSCHSTLDLLSPGEDKTFSGKSVNPPGFVSNNLFIFIFIFFAYFF